MNRSHYSQRISSINARPTTFAIQELLNLTSDNLVTAHTYANHPVYPTYLSQPNLLSSYQYLSGGCANGDVSLPLVHSSHSNFYQQFSPKNRLESLRDCFGIIEE